MLTMSPPSLLSCFLLTISLQWGLSLLRSVGAISLSSSGFSVTLNDIPYFVSPYSSGKVSLKVVDVSTCVSIAGLYPITVLSNITTADDSSLLMESFMAQDDVFQTGFMQSM